MPSLQTMYDWAIGTCNDDSVLYSQANRGKTIDGYTYMDCSYFVGAALQAGGWDIDPNNFYTSNAESKILGLDLWKSFSASSVYHAGDIGLTLSSNSGHIRICYQGSDTPGEGIFMGAQNDYESTPLSDQVVIGGVGDTNYLEHYPYMFRYYGEGEPQPSESVAVASFAVIAAICGNFWRESWGCNPAISQYGAYVTKGVQGVGYGLGQWTNQGDAARYDYLYNFCKNNGLEISDGENQLNFLMYEDQYLPRTGWIKAESPYTSVAQFLQSEETDIDTLTYWWCMDWERAGVSALEERYEDAHQAYEYLLEHWDDTVEWHKNPAYAPLDTQYTLDNCVRIYQFFNDYLGGVNMGKNNSTTESHSSDGGTPSTGDEGKSTNPVTTLADIMTALLGRSGNNQNSLKIHRKRT